jgi:ATP-dependent DNA helicase 2 subunit 1
MEVAKTPQEEVLDDNGAQERPPGFHMIPLPYADDIRAAPVEEALQGGTNGPCE